MANNFRSNSDSFKPGILHLKQKLLNREIIEPRKKVGDGRKKRCLEVSTYDISSDFHALGFSCVGITLTANNTGVWKNGTPGRLGNQELAQALKKSLYTLVKRTLSTIPIWATWVYERHKNGSPHIHAMLFCPVRDVFRLSQKCKKICNDKAVVVSVLSPDYLFKFEKMSYEWDLVETTDLFPAALCKKLIGRTIGYYDDLKKKYVRRNVSRIKDVQKTKELFDLCNSKLCKKYPSAEGILQSLFFELWRFWKYSHCRPKKERVADNPDLYDSLILKKQSEDECPSSTDEPQDFALEDEEDEEDDEPFPVSRFVVVQPSLGAFGRDVACKLKTKADDELVQLDVTLWTKNNTERLHVNLKNIYLTKTQIHNLKLWAKKCRNKDDLLVLYRTLFSGKKINGKNPLRMLDFSPQNLSEYDRELITPRYDIRSWLGYVTPLLKKQSKPLDSDFDTSALLADLYAIWDFESREAYERQRREELAFHPDV